MPAKIKLTDKKTKQIIRLYEKEMMSIHEIGKKVQLSHGFIYTFLFEKKIKIRKAGTRYYIHPEKWNKIIKLYLEKKFSVSKISKKYKVNRGCIETILKNNNIILRNSFLNNLYSSSPLTNKQIKKIISDYVNEKIDTVEIRKKYKISHERMLKIFKENNIKQRNRSEIVKIKLNKQEINKIVNDYNNGKSICLIAKEFGFSTPTIKRFLIENNIEIQNGGTRIYSIKETRSKGISGHYKKFYFRSINELSFIINYLEYKNINAIGEKSYYIEYLDKNNKKRKYFPDFTTDKYIFEIKPKRFWYTDEVIYKKKAAEKFAKERGLKYLLVDYPVKIEPIINAYLNNHVNFTEIGFKKFIRNYNKELTKLCF